MKFIYKVKVKDQKYIFDSKEQFEKFKLGNPSLTFEVIERIDIIEGMEKIVKPHPPTTRELLLMFMKEQREFNEQQIKFNNKIEAFNSKVQAFMDEQIKFNTKVQTFMDEQVKFNTKVQTFMDNQNVFNNNVQNYMDSHP